MDVSIDTATITHTKAGFIGMKKYKAENTAQMTDAQTKAMRLEPTQRVKAGLTAPKTIQVASLKAMKAV